MPSLETLKRLATSLVVTIAVLFQSSGDALANTVSTSSLELGLAYQGGDQTQLIPYYELSFGQRFNDYLSTNAIIVNTHRQLNHDKPYSPEVAVGTFRFGIREFALDFGRTGISLGLTPPVYAGRLTTASRPSIDAITTRLALDAFGVPDYSVGAIGTTGKVSYGFHYYRLQEEKLANILALGIQSGAFQRPGDLIVNEVLDGTEITGGCSLCSVISLLTGYDNDRNDRFDNFTLEYINQVAGLDLTMAGNSTTITESSNVNFGDEGYHVGVYIDDYTFRSAIDITVLNSFGKTYIIVPAIEKNHENITVGVQGFYFSSGGFDDAMVGAHTWFTVELSNTLMTYGRYGHYTGNVKSIEYGFGIIKNIENLYMKAGVDYLSSDIGLSEYGKSHIWIPMVSLGLVF